MVSGSGLLCEVGMGGGVGVGVGEGVRGGVVVCSERVEARGGQRGQGVGKG